MLTPIISLHQIKHYDMKKAYSLNIYKDEKVLITGPNGVGKTTLLQIIAGWIKPQQGHAYIKNVNIGYLHGMKYLPKQMRVLEFLHQLYQIYGASIDPWLWMILFIDQQKMIHQLSKGQKQKLLLIMCFLGNPDIVLLDEPFDGLDKLTTEKLLHYIQAYQHTIIMTSHQALMTSFKKHIRL
ncbi:MAG: ABC transporter ATP-binding protein [Acholeplasmataceae bacterium]